MARYLLLHGFGGVGSDHWLVWLSTELRARGHVARIRKLPSPGAPVLEAWLAALDERLAALADPSGLDEKGDPTGELVVVGHSLGGRLWLHHAQRATKDAKGSSAPAVLADRVALVCPPRLPPDLGDNPFAALDPARIDPGRVARHTRMVVSTDDPYWPGGGAMAGLAEPLGVPVDVIGDHGHLEPADGYGPWPAMLAWCLGEASTITA